MTSFNPTHSRNAGRSSVQTVIDALARSPRPHPPETFTAQVMSRIRSSAPASEVNDTGRSPCRPSRWRDWVWTPATGIRECVWCYWLVGFFLLIMGLVMRLAMHRLSTAESMTGWLSLQPALTLGLALLLIGSGGLVALRHPAAWRTARSATLLYMAFVCLNALILACLPQPPFPLLGLALYTLGALFLGAFLLVTVQYCRTTHRNGPDRFSLRGYAGGDIVHRREEATP